MRADRGTAGLAAIVVLAILALIAVMRTRPELFRRDPVLLSEGSSSREPRQGTFEQHPSQPLQQKAQPDKSSLLSEPVMMAVSDSDPREFWSVDLEGDLAVATTGAGSILFRDALAEPEVVTRMVAWNGVLSGHLLFTSSSPLYEAMMAGGFDSEYDDVSTIAVHEVAENEDVYRLSEFQVPGVTTDLEVRDEWLYRAYTVDRPDPSDAEAVRDHFLTVYDIAIPDSPVVLREVELESRYEHVPMAVSESDREILAIAATSGATDYSSDSVVVVDVSAASGPGTHVIFVGYEIATIAAVDGNRFVVVGEQDVAVIDRDSSGAFVVSTTARVAETLSSVADVSGSILYAMINADGSDVLDARRADTLIAIDLDGASGPEEAWRDVLDVPIELIEMVHVDDQMMVAVTTGGPAVYSLEHRRVAEVVPEAAFRREWVGLESIDGGVVVADYYHGLDVLRFAPGGFLEATDRIELPDGFSPTRGLELIDGMLFVVALGPNNSSELFAVTLDGDVLSRVAIQDLIGAWEWTSRIWSTHYDEMLIMGINDRIVAIDVSNAESPRLVDAIPLADSVRGLDVGWTSDEIPIVCASTEDNILACYRLNPEAFLESIGMLDLTIGARDLRIRDGLIYVAGPMGGVSTASVSAAGLREISYADSGYWHNASSIEVEGNLALVGSYDGSGIQVFDVSDPGSIEFSGYGDWVAYVEFMAVDDVGRIYIVTDADVTVLDVSDPEAIEVIGVRRGTG